MERNALLEAEQPATQTEPAGEAPPESHHVSRRSLLKGLGVAGVTVFVAGTGVVTYRSFDNGVLDPGSGTPYDAWDSWQNDPGPLGAVAAAVLAANPHNTQPWLFHVAGDTIDVYGDAGRTMPNMDALLREHDLGLGCAVENLLLAADARGLLPSLRLTPGADNPAHVAQVSLGRGAAKASRLYEAIPDRHSNRGPYTSAPVPATTLDELSRLADDLPGVSLRWFTSTVEKAALGALIIEATEAVIGDLGQSVEGFAWFRNNRDDIDAHQDGLTLDGQGLSDLSLAAAKILPAYSRVGGDDFWLTQTRTVQTATAAAYGVITVADATNLTQRLIGGRLLQRIHLAATADGLGLQHMNQITERIDRDEAQHHDAVFLDRFQHLIDQPHRQGLATFRIGLPERPARRSPRRLLATVLE